MKGILTKTLLAGICTVAITTAPALTQEKAKPQYGGSLEIGSEYPTLSALSWDPADWVWKFNQDTGAYFEQLVAGDLSKSVSRGGPFRFVSGSWLPTESFRGELAESWELKDNPLAAVFRLRKGIMWPAKDGVMPSRELTAEDVAFSFNRMITSARKLPKIYDFIDRVEATDKYTVTYYMKEFNAEWDYLIAWGYYTATVPKELVDANIKEWKNATGTGPFMLTEMLPGNSQTYKKREGYWNKEIIDEKEYQLPFVDQFSFRIIKDESTQLTALRTAKLDMLLSIQANAVADLKRQVPDLQWNRRLTQSAPMLAMRTDTKPFDDVRVRRAMNMAVNKDEIAKQYYSGNAELFTFPMHAEWTGYFRPLAEMPAEVQELFQYNPEKAKKLLAEAGYPNGFTFKAQVCSCNADHQDLLPLVASYLEKVGVKLEIQPMEYAAFLSVMQSNKNAAGYMMGSGQTNPISVMRKDFTTGGGYNPAAYSKPEYDARVAELLRTRDESVRKTMIREMTVDILKESPYVWLPSPYVYTAWWPWVKNYSGELSVGSTRPGPVFARIWIDHDLKKKMGR
jgi:peptide/nickel transport system substrate-binding protein